MRRIILAAAVFVAICNLAIAQNQAPLGPLASGNAAPCTAFGTTAGTCAQGNDSRITGAAPASTTVSKLGQSTLPFVLVPSGSFGNNGAYTTANAAQVTAYPNAYCSVPAGAIATGVPAAQTWYYCTWQSTTAATFFNNTYTSGTPAIPGSPTAFATTGPGAFTQTTGSNIPAYTLSIPGNTIGLNGSIVVQFSKSNNNSGNSKTFSVSYSTYSFGSIAVTTATGGGFPAAFSNRGVANVQTLLGGSGLTFNGTGTPAYGAIDSTAAQNLVVNLQLATATDTMVLESAVVELLPGVP